MRSSLVVVLVALLAAMCGPSGAFAEDINADASIQDGGVDVVVEETGHTPGQPGGPAAGPVLECTSIVYIHDDSATGGLRWDPVSQQMVPAYSGVTRYFSSTGRWLIERCAWSDEPGSLFSQRTYPEGEAVDPTDLMLQASARLNPPDPSISTAPPASSDLLVQTPTWLWVDQAYWRPYSETASTGRVSATATATPVAVTWDMGNGDTLVCRNPGTAWRPGLAVTSSSCSYTYRHSSAGHPGNAFDLKATVTLDVVWTSVNASGAGGALGSLTRSSTISVRVGEVQALVVAD